MPPGDIGASNATRGYWGVKCHLGIIGESNVTRASKGVYVHEESKIGASEIRGVRDQVGGSGVKIRASGFPSSKVLGVKGDESWLMNGLLLLDYIMRLIIRSVEAGYLGSEA